MFKDKKYAAASTVFRLCIRQNKTILFMLIFLPMILANVTIISNSSLMEIPGALRQYIDSSMSNPLIIALFGRVHAENIPYLTAWRIQTTTSIFAAIFSMISVISFTRRADDMMYSHIVHSGSVGRIVPTLTVLIKVYCGNLLGGAMMAITYISSGFPVMGSLLSALSFCLTGCFFGSVASFCCQISPNTSSATAKSYFILGMSLLLSGAGNLVPNLGFILYLSPIGWGGAVRAFSGDRFYALLWPILIISLITSMVLRIGENLDNMIEVIDSKSNKRRFYNKINGIFGLYLRLNFAQLLKWIISYAAIGTALGSLVYTAEFFLPEASVLDPWASFYGSKFLGFAHSCIFIMSIISTVYSLSVISSMRNEESEQRIHLLLSCAISKTKWAACQIVFAFIGCALISVTSSMFLACTMGIITGGWSETFRFLVASLQTIPAVWLITASAVFLFGIIPKLSQTISWALAGIFGMFGFLWEFKALDPELFRLSPFYYTYPLYKIQAPQLLMLLIFAAVLTATGLYLWRNRDFEE